ncbi:MAG TPA: hypothetical protein VIT88_10905 [Pyrinomonadaceae bacterium]
MKHRFQLILGVPTVLFLATTLLLAQDKTTTQTLSQQFHIPQGSRIFISAMEGKLDGFIAAELVKKKLPIVVVIDDKDADFIIAGASVKGDDKWFHSVFGGKDKNEANIQVISVKTKTVVWAGEAGDRSLWWGNVRRGGQRRVADRLVDKMKKDLFRK